MVYLLFSASFFTLIKGHNSVKIIVHYGSAPQMLYQAHLAIKGQDFYAVLIIGSHGSAFLSDR